MMEELKQKVGQFEQELKSWSVNSSAELNALQENMGVIEKHIRQQQKLLCERQEKIADLTKENSEMRGILDDLLRSAEHLMKTGPQNRILDLKERSSELVTTASAMAKTSNTPAAAGSNTSPSSVAVAAKQQTKQESNKCDEKSASTPALSVPAEFSAADSEKVTQSENEKAPQGRASNATSYVGKNRVDGLMDQVERLMSND